MYFLFLQYTNFKLIAVFLIEVSSVSMQVD